MDQKIANDVINDVLTKWAIEFIRLRQQIADAKLGKATGEGIQSFDHSVIKANGAEVAQALFQFNEYLRFADMSSKSWSTMPPISAMEQYVKDKGVEKFKKKYIAKYGTAPKDITKLINKIAWGIALTIKKRGRLKKKRVRWYSKSYNKGLGALYTQLLDALSKESLDQLKKELKNVST